MRKIYIFAITPLLLAMYGCSSGGGDGTPAPGVASSGLFLDAEVEGLSFTTDSGISGTTDENGTYTYLPGEDVNFSVGGVDLGTVAGAPVCTPFDFAAASTNIARFLQSLDADGDPSNGIDIVAASTALAGTTISSDAFLADTATFEANTDITGAITDGGGALITEAEALINLNLGTDNTFAPAELSDKLFVVLDPTNADIGVMLFEGNGTVSSVFPEETTSGGGDGSSFDENWVINSSGQLVLTDPVEGFTTIVNRLGGSTRSISVTYSEDGASALPATLLIPQAITYDDLAGPGIGDTRTFDVIDSDGTPLSVVITRSATAATYIVDANPNDTGTFIIDDIAPNVVTITDDGEPTEVTFMILLDGDPAVIDVTANVLFVGATIVGDPEAADPDLEFSDIGVASFTLKSETTAP